MCGTIPIMTLPVYRLNRENYNSQRAMYVEKIIFGGAGGEFKRQFAKDDPNWLNTFSEHLIKSYGGSWEYNEIIGFIELHFLGRQVRGKYIENSKKKQVRTRKKQFVYITHKLAPEIDIPRNANNRKIESLISLYIESCRKELRLRFIDDSGFVNLKKYIDWKGLLNGIPA